MFSHAHARLRRTIAAVTSTLLLTAGLTVVTEAIAPTSASAAQNPTQCQGTVSLTNGSFESPAIGNATYRLIPEAQVPGWLTNDSANQIEVWSSGFQGVSAAQGRQFAELNANSASMLYQDVATTPGQTLAWSLKHRARQGTDVMRVVIGVPGGTLVQSGPNLSDTTAAWGAHSGTYTVPAGQTVTRFGFEAVSAGSGNASVGNFLDDITFGTGPCLVTTKSVTNLTRGGSTAEVGDVLRYTVTTVNNGGNPATQAVSTDQLAAGIDFVPGSVKITAGAGAGALTDASGDDRGEYAAGSRTVRVRLGDNGSATVGGSIGVGASTSYTFDAKVAVSAAATTVLNEANVAFHDGVVNQNRTSTSNEVQTPVNAAADLAIAKTLDTSPLVAGEPATFTITVTNNGPQTATGVSVTDAVPAGFAVTQVTPAQGTCTIGASISCTLGSLAVNASSTITVTGTVSASMSPGAALTNTASVSGTLTDPNLSNNTASASGTLTAEADVSIIKTYAPAAPVAGQNVTYTLAVHNDGPSEARDLRVTDPLDPATTFVSVSPQQGSCSMTGQTLGCLVGTLAPGATTTITVTVALASGASAVVQNSASVTSSTPDPDPSNNVDSTSFNPTIIADLAVTKTASAAQVAAGGTVTYTMVVTNNGSSDAVNAVLSDTLPTGLTVISATATSGSCTTTSGGVECTWPTLAEGASSTVTVQALVAADAPAGTLTNTASVASPAQDSTPENNSDSADVEVVQSADISVVKTADASAVPGGGFGYTLTVSNGGPSVARGVVASDTLPAGFVIGATPAGCVLSGSTLTCAVGDLTVGQVVQIRIEGALAESATGTLSNTATVTSPTPDPDPSDNTSTVDKPLTPSADVVVTKTTSTPSVPLEGEASFVVTVRNDGPSTAAGVVVDEAAAPGLIIVNATPSVGTWSAADARWTVGTLLPGESATLTVTARVVATGAVTNTATGTSQTPDPDPSNNTGTSTIDGTPSADLSIVKTASVNPAQLNAPITYTIVVTNNGPSAASAVSVTDPLPAALLNPTTPTSGCTITTAQLDCTVGTLAVGATFTATVTGTVDPATPDAQLSNTATVTSTTPDPDPSDNSSTSTVPVAGTPRIELEKAVAAPVDANGNGRIDQGDTVAYTFTVRNTGDATFTSTQITDSKLGGAVTCAALGAPLAPGAGVTCAPVTYTLTQQDIDNGTVHNEATVTGQSARGTATDDAEANVIVPSVNSVSLTKTPSTVVDINSDNQVNAGDTIQYTFTLTNTGTTTLHNGQIDDPMLGGAVTCDALEGAVLAPGQSVTCDPVAYTLTQDDIDNGVVRNTASTIAQGPDNRFVEDTASASADIDQTAGIELTKKAGQVTDANDDGFVGAGDTIDYSFTVQNSGNTTLTDVAVTDPLLGTGALCTIAELLPGASADCGPFTYALTQADIEAERRPNTATATGDSPIGEVGDEGSAEVMFAGTTAIALTKTPGSIDPGADGMVGAGDTVPYTFTVRNTGTTALRNIVLTDPLLGGELECPALDGLELMPGRDATCGPIDYTLTQADVDAGTVHNTASVEGESWREVAEATDEADVAVIGTDALSLLKSAAAIVDANDTGRTDAGDTIAYTFTVRNTGTTTLTGVSVSDPRLTGDIVCDTTELAPGASTVCAGEPAVLTQAEVDAGEIINTATATGTGTGEEPPTIEDTVVTPIEAQPAIALTKTGGDYADADGDGRINAGDTVKFRFTVTNTGSRTLTGIVITDPMLGGAIDCDIADLAPGAATDCGPVTYALTAADVAAGKVVNVATVSGAAGAVTVTAAATASVDLQVLATTGGVVTGLGWALALLAIGALVLLVARVRRREAAI
ncbi:putative repeat protein (TIGR01451 family) [Microbacterium natoriense]|uniref:Repeat protein (TIGR01451 family) n=1 Tax=Microbacterium natoriense TaxID=284570 RepID=A0AAW8F1J0_9MICO|nr:hypothetical protein [Microbacterium natoriense]MDQ0649461.1 putative repeat protein (TIGR01451 family) [Microbacterium natoriense]